MTEKQLRALARKQGWKWDEWVRGPLDLRALKEGCRPDPQRAERPIRLAEKYLVVDRGRMAGKPFRFLPWQRDIVRRLFGWLREDGTRRYRRAGIWVPKKNGKSYFVSPLALYMLVADGEPQAEVYIGARDREQASIIFSRVASLVRNSPLAGHVRVIDSTKRIVHDRSGSVLRALSADAYKHEGLDAHCVIIDELHALHNRQLWDTLMYAGAARTQPLFLSISTAGDNRNGLAYEQYAYAKGVIDGTIEDPYFFACIYEAAPGDDWTDEAVWAKANPSLGMTLTIESLRDDFLEAKHDKTKELVFRRRHLNQWTEHVTTWIGVDQWDRCADPGLDIPPDSDVYAGLDLAATGDINALALAWREDEDICLKTLFWVPEIPARRRDRSDRVPYTAWIDDGHLRVTEGEVTDYARIRRDINELAQRCRIVQIAVDRTFQGAQLCTELMQDGFAVIAHGQGIAQMAGPTRELKQAVLSGRLRHDGNPVMRWMIGNVMVETDAEGNEKPSKRRSADKIDGVVAAAMAVGRLTAERDEAASVYDERGFIVLDG